ncbi:Rrf2 family transcriptional regulator [Paucibacter sp. M5-1]|uniref:Rrf2 family transcriptional regulator n=1 Tax=Paucibacter sp. M5-1 TaxID=3015998 RepID=UPI0022B910F4|nr:Rrf2 family transcriptional regulator [Paucibacter sp. M5-1]MCZ7882000.1 Rrf2 family transcriptional regulator [Paucibacter sp. M5-1]
MTRDSRLSAVLHVLLHLAEMDGPATSETLAKAMGSNPVVVRRLLGGLREAGFVASEKGHGGGWSLACRLTDISLRDVHEALGAPTLLAIGHRSEHPDCLVEKAVNAALGSAFTEAEALLLARLGGVSLAQLSADFHQRLKSHRGTAHQHHHDHDF